MVAQPTNADKNVPPNLVQGLNFLDGGKPEGTFWTRLIVLCPHRPRQLLDGQLVDKVQFSVSTKELNLCCFILSRWSICCYSAVLQSMRKIRMARHRCTMRH